MLCFKMAWRSLFWAAAVGRILNLFVFDFSIMDSFISYNHKDSEMLELLHTHLAQLKRDGLIISWTDREIEAGGRVDNQIADALQRAELFIALLSPAYIDSRYCYEKEFKQAQDREASGTMTIAPVIVQPCEWLNTPFSKFKALPRDGKPVAEWNNVNAAFLDVVQQLRKLVTAPKPEILIGTRTESVQGLLSRNYRVKKNFDSIQKMEFVSQAFGEVKDFIRRYVEEVRTLDEVKVMPMVNTDTKYDRMLVNRNRIKSEAKLTITTDQQSGGFSVLRGSGMQLYYCIGLLSSTAQYQSFALAWDEFRLFWSDGPLAGFYGRSTNTGLSSKEIAERIFNEWLTAVGIL